VNTYFGIEHLDELEHSISICFDVETLALQPERGKLRLLQMACNVSQTVVVIDCFELEEDDWRRLRIFFENGERFWLAHNAVFDLGWLQEHDLYPRGYVRCSMLASKLLMNGIPNAKHGLAHVVQRYLKRELDKEEQRSDWSGQLTKSQIDYAINDVVALAELDTVLQQRLQTARLSSAFALECKALPAMAQMWRVGLPWDRESLNNLIRDYEFDIAQLEKDVLRQMDAALPEGKKLPRDDDGSFNTRPKDTGSVRAGTKKLAGFNINSPKQLVGALTTILGTAPKDPKTGKVSAARGALRGYAADHVVVQTYLEWKKSEKRRQMAASILEHLGTDGFVRASYLQMGAETGRMSCIKPNNQQIPRDEIFRSCVSAPEGWALVDADFGQMELRLAAAVADDERMALAFQQGEDLHTVTAEAIGCSRQIAKSANFGLLYGSGAKGLRDYAGAMGITMTIAEAADIRDKWLSTYEGIHRWQRQQAAAADNSRHDQWAETRIPETNMRRFLPGDMNRLTVRANTPIQGAGAAILKCCLGNLWPLLLEAGEDEAKLAACVHDEILLLVRKGSEEEWRSKLKRVMENAESKWLGDIPALAEVNVGQRWSEVH
jgi:DNA polymerase I-like protein with 3'-5' exonuclease and polymerase domains